ncbi:MAG: DUF302 domain-containing protein [bacterium]|nr:DUF302 domain-containing protein [bacterium]
MTMMDKMMDAMMESLEPEEKQQSILKLMPEMIKRVNTADLFDIFQGAISKMMFKTYRSKLGFEETIREIKTRGEAAGWYKPAVANHYDIERELGIADANKVATISMCIPKAAHKILKVNPQLAVMMPVQINVYEDAGHVNIAWMNIGLMGEMFGKVVAGVMKNAIEDLNRVHEDIIEKEEGCDEHIG